MPMSALARAISTSARRLVKNGQSCAISHISSWPWVSSAASSPRPMPYQPGRRWRFCVQEKTQGMARRLSMPLPLRLEAGREPISSRSMTSIGVASRK